MITVLTYNVSHEHMKDAKGQKWKKCKDSNTQTVSACRRNVLKIMIGQHSRPADVIMIQEGDKQLALRLREKLGNNGHKYDLFGSQNASIANVFTLVNKKLGHLHAKVSFGEVLDSPGRPWLNVYLDGIRNQTWDGGLFLINAHAPHGKQSWIKEHIKNTTTKDAAVILSGDFNKEIKHNFQIENSKFSVLNKDKFKTCCISPKRQDKAEYKLAYDNIIISNELRALLVETLPGTVFLPSDSDGTLRKATSDHLPLFALLDF